MSPRLPKGQPMETLYSMTHVELRRLEALERFRAGGLTQAEVAIQLQLSVRQVKRLWQRYRQGGPLELRSRRRGKPSNRRLDPQLIATAIELVAQHYPDFGPTFAAEKLAERHQLQIGRETLRKAMITAGLHRLHPRRRPRSHQPRERRPCFGELVQGDGSPHAWFEKRAPRCTLLLFVDDATGKILAARFEPSETTHGYFELCRQHIERYGKPLAYYVDRSTIFQGNHRAVYAEPSQFARAMHQLGIELICANSPQAKGRVERLNGTLQQRLTKELRLRNISAIDAANAYLPQFVEAHNARFGVEARSCTDAHRPVSERDDLTRILCHVETRTISRNLTVVYKQQLVRILAPEQQRRLRFQKVIVREMPHGLEIEHRGELLAFEVGLRQPKPVVLNSKALEAHLEQTHPRLDPRKQQMPAANHPWRHNKLTPSWAPPQR
jgi:transposase